ncbi:MAG: TrkH family potassium uptake protein [Betaproteobacteria bacterium]|nr:TrkH family potassium uptake protein [Betaproteobacteria bacterium]
MNVAIRRLGFIGNYLPVLFGLGVVLMLFGGAMLIPLTVSLILNDAALLAYDEAFAITVISGTALWFVARSGSHELKVRDGYLLVTVVWMTVPAFAALPFMIYFPALSFTDAYFEAMAGLTTTGATVLTGLDQLPPSILIWRGLLQWIGGMGIIVLFVAILPMLGVGGRQLYKAETPGPIKELGLTPRIGATAKRLWLLYAGITLICILSYRLAGMSWLDAVVHSFTTMSLGGFSTHDESFAFFNSPLIESVAIVFMLISGMNFATHYLALLKRSAEPYRQDWEARWFLTTMIASSLGVAAFLWLSAVYPNFSTALRYAAFNVISIGTTTGYASTDYSLWPMFAPVLMLLLCATASSAGSTGGGIKMIRTQLLVLQSWREMVKLLHPNALVPVRIQGHVVPNQIVFAVLAFMSLYGASIIVLTMVLLASGLDFVTAFSAVVACITSTGPGLNQVGPATTYASLSDVQTWVLSVAMLLGRLEIFTVMVVFTPAFWRK